MTDTLSRLQAALLAQTVHHLEELIEDINDMLTEADIEGEEIDGEGNKLPPT